MCGILVESRRFHQEETKEKEQQGGGERKRKEEKESEEALIKPAARRVIKTRARPTDSDGSSGWSLSTRRRFSNLRSPRDRNIGEIGRDTADLHSRKDSERLERRLKRAPAPHNEDVSRARRFG